MWKWFKKLFQEEEPQLVGKPSEYLTGWNTADTIIANAPMPIAIRAISNKTGSPDFVQGMYDRLKEEGN